MNLEQVLLSQENYCGRRFGVEIEVYNISQERAATVLTDAGIDCRYEEYNHTTRTWWKTVPDGSLPANSAEVVSPPLPFTKESLEQVAKVLSTLRTSGALVNQSCGLHVHIDAQNIADYENFAYRLYQRYRICEPDIDKFIATHRRGNTSSSYSRTLDYNPRSYQNILANVSRGSKLNLHSYAVHGTVEFRHHEGCLNEMKVVAWIMFCMNFFESTLAFHTSNTEDNASVNRGLFQATR